MEGSVVAEENVPLGTRCSLGVGGPARRYVSALTVDEAADVLRSSMEDNDPVLVLGAGTNVVISDDGWPGTVLHLADYRLDLRREQGRALLQVGAGVEWDELVAFAVTEGYQGIECLSGIPGTVGAAPIQNIGAYGAELSETLVKVEVLERASLERLWLDASALGLGYRTSLFKSAWRDRYLITAVELSLAIGGRCTPRYAELRDALGGKDRVPPSAARQAVLHLRKRKSMLLRPEDPNARSVGSFFTNPCLTPEELALLMGGLTDDEAASLPRWPTADGRTKVAAAWLVERAGFGKGFTLGHAGLSSAHSLAIINRGNALASDIIALASIIRRQVRQRFGVTLDAEPTFLGFQRPTDLLLG